MDLSLTSRTQTWLSGLSTHIRISNPSVQHCAPHKSSQQRAEPPPGIRSCNRSSLAPTIPTSPLSMVFWGMYRPLPLQWHILQTRSSPLAEEGELSPSAQTCSCYNSFCIAKMPLLCLGRSELRFTETWPFSVPKSRPSLGRMSWSGNLSWGPMTVFSCIIIHHLALQPRGKFQVYTDSNPMQMGVY